ncbi:hypothetical protein [Kushneria phosphatilytica]|uniref:Uncharacterized protein n=1 Tax=Kushneria phosphatilytica TaxID=657387 RepID=A0A1S1P1F6_9GAMM|nr:hypothetical protein [Kushneria phosphatilytica]OHV13887.1 hypothetical protein BH688_00635 [Kushneria phosphatilytica]QEL10446.1 hypothetical protein FY550_04375 [Kushneria phosphatilytica]
MNYRCLPWLIALTLLLGGCQIEQEKQTAGIQCYTHGIPTLVDNACMLPTWVAFGLKSQTADKDWRDQVLEYMDGDTLREKLVRATALAWGDPEHWSEANRLFEDNIDHAPADIRPLLEQWQGELELRRHMQANSHQRGQNTAELKARIDKLKAENDRLSAKLDALTAIEESMNQRRSSP